MATIYGSSSGGKKYTIGSQKGQDFVNNAKPGSTLKGADGSSWTKNNDGSTTIVQNGVSYTVGGTSGNSGGTNVIFKGGNTIGSSSSGASPSRPSYNRPSGGGSYPPGGSSGGSPAYNPNLNRPDYSIMIRDAINSGASWNEVQDLLDKRTSIAIGDPNLNKYAYDNTWTSATDYINQKKNEEWQAQINAYYDQIAAQQEAAQRAAVSQAVNQLSGQKGDVEQSYDDLYRQLYLDRRMAEKNMPQQLAAMGISGGLSESTLLGTQTAYTDALRQGEQEKLGTLNDIDQAIANAQLTGDINIAQQAAQLAMNRLQSYGDLISQLQNQQRWAAEFAANQNQALIGNNQWQQTFNRQQMLDQMNRDDLSYDRKLQIAQYLYENTGDVSGFRSIGLTDQQIAALQSSYAAAMQQMTARSGGSGGSSSGGGDDAGKGGNLAADALDWASRTGGNPEDFIRAYYKDYGYSSHIQALAALAVYEVENPAEITGPDQLGATARTLYNNMVRRYTSANRTSFASDIKNALNAGRITEAEADFILAAIGF